MNPEFVYRHRFEARYARSRHAGARQGRDNDDISGNRDGGRGAPPVPGKPRESHPDGRGGCGGAEYRVGAWAMCRSGKPSSFRPPLPLRPWTLVRLCRACGLIPAMVLHTCPVCGSRHEVHPILDRLACGSQLTCSPRCKVRFPASRAGQNTGRYGGKRDGETAIWRRMIKLPRVHKRTSIQPDFQEKHHLTPCFRARKKIFKMNYGKLPP